MTPEQMDRYTTAVAEAADEYAAEVSRKGYTDEQSATLAFIAGAQFVITQISQVMDARKKFSQNSTTER